MRKAWMAAALAAATALAAAGPADAAVRFDIVQTGASPPGEFAFGGSVVVTDEAAANGFMFSLSNSGTPTNVSLDGLIALDLQTTVFNTVFSLADFTGSFDFRRGGFYTIALAGSAATGLTGSLYANNGGSDLGLTLAGFSATGFVNSDFDLSGCAFNGRCNFTAAVIVQQVPEPASAALLGAGLLGLFAARRRISAP